MHITNLIWSCPAGRVYWNGNCDLYLHAQSWGVRNGPTHSSPGWGFWDWMFCSTREALKSNWPNFLWQITSDVMNSKWNVMLWILNEMNSKLFKIVFTSSSLCKNMQKNIANSMKGQIYMSQKRSRVDFLWDILNVNQEEFIWTWLLSMNIYLIIILWITLIFISAMRKHMWVVLVLLYNFCRNASVVLH